MVYDGAVAAVAIVHIGAGSVYFGSSVVTEVLFSRVLRKTETVGEWRAHGKLFTPISQVDGATAMVALISGLAFLAAKYPPFDLGAYASLPNTRPLLIALGLFVVIMALAGAFFAPQTKKLVAMPLPEDDHAPLPPDVRDSLAKFTRVVHVQVAVVMTIVLMMVLAANGGF